MDRREGATRQMPVKQLRAAVMENDHIQQRFSPTVFKKQCFGLFTAFSVAWGYCISTLSWSCSKYKVAAHIRLLHTEWLLTCGS